MPITHCSYPWGWGALPIVWRGVGGLLFLYSFSLQGCELFNKFYSHKTSLDLTGRHWALIVCFFLFFPSKVFKRSFNLDVSCTDHVNNKYKMERKQLHQPRFFEEMFDLLSSASSFLSFSEIFNHKTSDFRRLYRSNMLMVLPFKYSYTI